MADRGKERGPTFFIDQNRDQQGRGAENKFAKIDFKGAPLPASFLFTYTSRSGFATDLCCLNGRLSLKSRIPVYLYTNNV